MYFTSIYQITKIHDTCTVTQSIEYLTCNQQVSSQIILQLLLQMDFIGIKRKREFKTDKMMMMTWSVLTADLLMKIMDWLELSGNIGSLMVLNKYWSNVLRDIKFWQLPNHYIQWPCTHSVQLIQIPRYLYACRDWIIECSDDEHVHCNSCANIPFLCNAKELTDLQMSASMLNSFRWNLLCTQMSALIQLNLEFAIAILSGISGPVSAVHAYHNCNTLSARAL